VAGKKHKNKTCLSLSIHSRDSVIDARSTGFKDATRVIDFVGLISVTTDGNHSRVAEIFQTRLSPVSGDIDQ
jgi:hypothetical protein